MDLQRCDRGLAPARDDVGVDGRERECHRRPALEALDEPRSRLVVAVERDVARRDVVEARGLDERASSSRSGENGASRLFATSGMSTCPPRTSPRRRAACPGPASRRSRRARRRSTRDVSRPAQRPCRGRTEGPAGTSRRRIALAERELLRIALDQLGAVPDALLRHREHRRREVEADEASEVRRCAPVRPAARLRFRRRRRASARRASARAARRGPAAKARKKAVTMISS